MSWMRSAVVVLGLVLAAAGCKQVFGLSDPGLTDAAAPPVATVGFASATTLADEESGLLTIPILLSEPTNWEVSITYSVTGGTADRGDDYTTETGVITIAPGATSAAVELTVVADAADEEDETIELALAKPSQASLGLATHTVTISANVLPRVSFSAASNSIAEAGGALAVTVNLNTASSKTISVPFSASSSSAMAPADYSYATSSPLMFTPGETQKTIMINIVNDNVDENNETIITALGTPTNSVLGAQAVHTLTITDDDTCVGPGDAFNVCYDTQPAAVSLPVSLDTDSSPYCAATQPAGWTAAGQPAACVVWADALTVSGLSVSGSRPLVLAGVSSIAVTGVLDVSSVRGAKAGPAAPFSMCPAFPTAPDSDLDGAGGGAGASFMSAGGDGGDGDGGGPNGGTAPAASTEPALLRGGCSGQRGGTSGGNMAGNPGVGGGALYLVSGGTITLGSTSIINASGSGGTGSTNDGTGGSGGGSGGMIRLHAAAFSVTGAKIVANGGGGAEGAGASGGNGSDPDPTMPTQPALGGSNMASLGNGGNGFAGTTQATSGDIGAANVGGGGGGGGSGLIRTNLALTGATTSPAPIVQ